MEIEFAVMARYVEYGEGGTLTIVGGCTAGFYSQPFPAPQAFPGAPYAVVGTPVTACVALQLSCARSEVGTLHSLRMTVVDSQRNTVFDSGDQPIQNPQLAETAPDRPLTFQLPAFCAFPPAAFGLHTVSLRLDGIEKKTVPFLVVAPPGNPVPGR